MAMPVLSRKKKRYRVNTDSSHLEDQLLNDDERALYELDQAFLHDATAGEGVPHTQRSTLTNCLHNCSVYCCLDKGFLSLITMFFVSVIGVAVLVLAMRLDLGPQVNELGRYILSAGVFGLASGGTNWIAVVGLFHKVPGLIGSGVFYRQHRQIRNIIKMIVLQMVFDSQHLETYITRKISQFSSNVRIVDNITAALNSPEAERIVEEKLEVLYVQPEGQYLEALGLSKVRLRPLIKPAVLSLCAETAPLVLDSVAEHRTDQGISVPQFREEMDRYLTWRAEAVTKREIGRLMRRHMYRHLSWIVVWGSVFGVLTGIVVQALKISLNFNIL